MEQNNSWSIVNVRLALVVPLVIATASIGFASPAEAAGTAAGTVINNSASATYNDAGGNPQTVPSNAVSLTVDEVLDVTVVSADAGNIVVQPGSTSRILSYTVTNNGNGPEDFRLTTNDTVGGDQFDPSVTQIYLDNMTPGQGTVGVYDPGVDPLYVPGTNDPSLAADAGIRVFVASTIPAGANDTDLGRVELTSRAVTGLGLSPRTPGTTVTGAGVGGGDAIFGTTEADGAAVGTYIVQNATISFAKTQSVTAPASLGGGTINAPNVSVGGGLKAVPGAIITYTLTATVAGSGTLTNVAVSDAIPANTTYQPGTMTLQGSPLTDASDADAGATSVSGSTVTGINVNLGSVGAGVRTVTFQVRINN